MANRILTGIKPTGQLTLGNYIGVLKNLKHETSKGECFFFIADLHALTLPIDPEVLRQNSIDLACFYLAAGIDPKKDTLFLQSSVSAHAELNAIMQNYLYMGELSRMTQFKDKSAKMNESAIGLGLFAYPVLMASDIILYDANIVPVGEDQLPMIEQTREIVEKFNRTYGETLIMPKAVIPENAIQRRLCGVDGKAKMSKSLGNCIYISDDPKTVKKQVNGKMFTDPQHLQISDPGHIEGNVVFTYLDAFCTDEHFSRYLPDYANLDEMKAHYRRGGLGDGTCKKFLINILEETLQPIRAERAKWEADIDAVYDILREGTTRAQEVTNATLARVRKAMRIDYFDDRSIIKEWEALLRK